MLNNETKLLTVFRRLRPENQDILLESVRLANAAEESARKTLRGDARRETAGAGNSRRKAK
jgi:hypothetical protein